MKDYSDGKIATIVTNTLPQLKFKELQTLKKTNIAGENKQTSNKGAQLTNGEDSDQGRFFKCGYDDIKAYNNIIIFFYQKYKFHMDLNKSQNYKMLVV